MKINDYLYKEGMMISYHGWHGEIINDDFPDDSRLVKLDKIYENLIVKCKELELLYP